MDTIRNHAQELLSETALQEMPQQDHRRYQLLVEESLEGIFIQKGSKIIFANQRLHAMLGYRQGELEGIDYRLVHPIDYPEFTRGNMTSVQRNSDFSRFEVMVRRKDGSPLDAEITARTIRFNGKSGLHAWVRDISECKPAEEEKKRREAEIRQVQKMQAVGTLAGGIAHHFNNLLMGIQGNTSLMIFETDSSNPHYKRLKNIERAVHRGAELSKQLLGFARGGKYELTLTNVNDLIEKSLGAFAGVKQGITIHARLQKDAWPIEVDREQIEKALFNLYINARQAMPVGGHLYVSGINVTLDRNYTRPFNVHLGNYVKIAITDTGIGMDKATRQRVFEPFFSTKDPSKGAGLGLASTYGIIKNHGGMIDVYSKKGEGSTFNVYLPASENGLRKKA